ncbi:MAG: OmpA family protein [Bacteroidota bacterium]
MKKLAVILLILATVGQLIAQKKGDKAYENLGYLASTDYYQDLAEDQQTYDVKLKLANSFRLNSQYEAAEYWYAKIINEVQQSETILHYAQTLQANGKCDDAIRWYKEYEAQSEDQTRSFIKDCKDIEKFDNHKNIKLANLSDLNTEHHDFSPIPHKDGIIFTSMRGGKKQITNNTDKWTNDNFSDLFYAKKEGDAYKSIKALSGDVNGNFHDGVATFSAPTKEMIFTRTSKEKSEAGDTKKLKIYKAKGEGENWKDTEELPFCDKEYSTCHPTLSTDGQRLYFSSDRPGGFGGMDIYVSQKLGTKWSDPINLGPTVNTAGNEIFPFISQKDKLFFASNGHKGIGGLDIFVVEKSVEGDENSWADRKNVGKPINSKKDDFGFYIDAEEETGFVSSNRPGGAGLDDIYSWEKTEADPNKKDPFDPDPDNPNEIVDAGKSGIYQIAVCDAKTQKRLENARVALLKSEDNWIAYEDENDLPNPILTTNIGGDFGIKIKGGVVRADASFTTNGNGVFNYFLEENKTYSFYAEKDYYRPTRQQLTGAQLMENTDYCIPLVKRSCVILKGAVKNKNFPKYIPGAEVTMIDKCTGAITTLETDFDGRFEMCIECNCEYDIKARKLNFKEGQSKVSTLNVPCNSTIVMNTLIELELDRLDPNSENFTPDYVNEYFTGDPAGNYQVGQEITLNQIYYDFDQHYIRADAANDLDYLILVMQEYPSMEIALASHTDSRGETDYNRWLSRSRSKSAKKYLIENGIEPYRINKAVGYGETQHVNDCYDGVECSEEEHQRNRRTVVTITKLDQAVKVNRVAEPRVIDRKPGF